IISLAVLGSVIARRSIRNRGVNTPPSPSAAPLPFGRGSLTYLINKLAVAVDGHVGAFHGPAFGHARQELAGNLRQQGASDNVIDVAGAAFHFLATAGDRGQQGIVVAERRLVVLAHTVADALELKLNDLLDHLVGKREIG